ncbi:hypothetical protein BDZ91DRAFT_43834 [Kalaharituber pfeilii]|nr:hypothetical protein BDZ91DRAFT_43834 [Kalaharituber pfeilii]
MSVNNAAAKKKIRWDSEFKPAELRRSAEHRYERLHLAIQTGTPKISTQWRKGEKKTEFSTYIIVSSGKAFCLFFLLAFAQETRTGKSSPSCVFVNNDFMSHRDCSAY